MAWLDTGLGIPETEIFDLFQRFRHYALRWLSKHPRQCNDIMENIVQTVTLIGRDQQGQYDAQTAQALKELSLASANSRGGSVAVPVKKRASTVAGGGISVGGEEGDGSNSNTQLQRRATRRPGGGTLVAGMRPGSSLGMGMGLRARDWKSLVAHGCYGRFVPDTEIESEMGGDGGGSSSSAEGAGRGRGKSIDGRAARAAAVSATHAGESFEQWLRRVTTLDVGTEINVQLGEFTMKKHRMTQLSRAVRRTPEFKAVFESPAAKTSGGNVLHPHTRVQCAEVQHTTLRAWWRLVGRRHDVQWWLPDVSRSPALPVPKHPSGNFAYGTANMPEKVAWVARTFEPVRRLFFNDASFELCGPPLPNSADRGQWAVLSGSVANTTRASWEAMRAAKKDAGVHDAAEAADCGRTLKEVVVFREPAVVHVYNVVEYGRRFFRTLVYSSDASYCLHGGLP